MAVIALLLGSVTKWVLGQRSVVEGTDFMTHITNWKKNLRWPCLLLHCATLGCEEHSFQSSHKLMNSVGMTEACWNNSQTQWRVIHGWVPWVQKSWLSGLGFMSFRDSLSYSGSRSEYSTTFFPKGIPPSWFCVTDSFSFIFSPVLCAYCMTCHSQIFTCLNKELCCDFQCMLSPSCMPSCCTAWAAQSTPRLCVTVLVKPERTALLPSASGQWEYVSISEEEFDLV